MNQDEQQIAGVIADFERVQTAKGRQGTGLYAVEGIRLVERAVRAGVPFRAVLITAVFGAESPRESALLEELSVAGIEPTLISDELMAQLTNGRSLGGIIGLAPLPDPVFLQEQLTGVKRPLLLVAHQIVDPGNLGAMMRTAHGLGCHALVAVGSSDLFHPKTVRTSMGSIFKLPLVQTASWSTLQQLLRPLGIRTVGTAVSGGIPLPKADWGTSGLAVVMGSEYWGLPSEMIEQLDMKVTIPMAAGVDSYSVNAAAAMVLYEIQRRPLE